MVGAIERCVVLGELLEARSPLTGAQLARRLRADEPSVQAALSALERYGQVRRLLPLDGSAAVFVFESQREREFVRCPGCGSVRAVDEHPLQLLRARLRERLGQELSFSRYVFAADCARCARDDLENPGARPGRS